MENKQGAPPDMSDSSMSSRNTTLNPFEVDSVDSLHLTQFSPSMFSKSVLTPSSSKSNGKFRWSIDQVAILHPADIDEYPIQQESTFDSDTEERAQQAIDQFFSQQHVVPSPWSVKKPVLKHVTFSPNPPTISEADDSVVECSPQKNTSMMKQPRERSEVSCQTTVSLPVDFDLLAALGGGFAIDDKDADDSNELCSSSLRRKLFSVGEASPSITLAKGGLTEPSPERIPDIPSPQVSPIKQIDESTLSGSDISLVQTPGSVQSQLSSSPISSKMTPNRWTPYRQGSSVLGLMQSPSFSPISSTAYSSASDSCNLVFNSSDISEMLPHGLMVPEASPILAVTSQSQAHIMTPFLDSAAPSSEEIMAMSFCADGNESDKNPASRPVKNNEAHMTCLLERNDLSVKDSYDRSDSNDLSDYSDSVELQSTSPDDAASSSMCSIEQSYLMHPSKCSDQFRSSGGPLVSAEHFFSDEDQDMMNPARNSMYVSDDMSSFQVDTSLGDRLFTSQKLLTSTLKLVPVNAPSVLNAISNTHLGLDTLSPDHSSGKLITQRSAALAGLNEASPRSKFMRREVTPMQSDSGFNTQSFTSMEVTDSEVIDMQTHEYSVDGYPMNDKENSIDGKTMR